METEDREIYNSYLRSRFKELGETEKSEEDQCCPMRLKIGGEELCDSI